MELGLQNKVAIVCGASQGMGQAIACGLANEGARVLLVARNAERLTAAAAAILAQNTNAQLATLAIDLTPADSAEEVVKTVKARWGRLDVLVTNTGGPPPGQPLDLSDEQYLLAYQQNFMNVVRLCRHAVPAMRVHGYGRIINLLALSVRQIEDNLVLWQYVKGKRSSVKWIRNTPTPSGQWHELKLVVAGSKVEGWLNGKSVLSHDLGRPVAGRVGLWSKADSVVYFDDFRVEPAQRKE